MLLQKDVPEQGKSPRGNDVRVLWHSAREEAGDKGWMRVCVYDAPKDYRDIVAGLPADLKFVPADDAPLDLVHIFTSERRGLRRTLEVLRTAIRPDGAIWVSWPKKSSRVTTDVDEDVVREEALAAGLVDVKVRGR